jgi:hypothetical protein
MNGRRKGRSDGRFQISDVGTISDRMGSREVGILRFLDFGIGDTAVLRFGDLEKCISQNLGKLIRLKSNPRPS